jgi:pyruvate dehydrogenase (quinone)
MPHTVAQLMVDTLHQAGVKRIYGVVGDSLNGFTDALRSRPDMQWVHMRHEEAAAFAAGAEAHLTSEVTVCAGSCGPGNLHLINGLFDCHRSRVPVVAIAAHIPSSEIGSGYFQATHPEILFQECSHYVELVSNAALLPRVLERAIRTAVAKRGVAVVVIPGDVALATTETKAPTWTMPRPSVLTPSEEDLGALAQLLNGSKRVALMCGAGSAGARDEIIDLAATLQAPIIHSLRGKEFIEYDNPYDVGMTGLIGFSSGYHAMRECDALLLVGTDFPYRQFYPEHAKVAQIDCRAESLGNRCRLDLGVLGDVKTTLAALLPKLSKKTDDSFLKAALGHYKKARHELDQLAVIKSGDKQIHPQAVARLLSEHASEDAVFTCDVGTQTVWAARYLKLNGKRRLIGSFNHGSMANAMLQAIGAQASHPERQVISMSGDGGFAMMMGDCLSLKQLNLPVKIVVLNNGTLGFVEMEMKANGFLDTGVDLQNPDFAAMARSIGIHGVRVEDPSQLEKAVQEVLAHPGPALLDVVSARQELVMPPTKTIEQATHFGLFLIKAVLDGRGTEVIDLAKQNLRL